MATRSPSAQVVDLAAARCDHKHRGYRERLGRVLEGNQRALQRLFHSGLIFTRQGTRAGRDLLLARQHLVKVGDLIGRLDASRPGNTEIYFELEDLLEKSDRLATRTDEFVASLK